MNASHDTTKFKRYLSEHSLSCVMNDTKWNRLFEELSGGDLPLLFSRKDVDEIESTAPYWDGDIFHIFGGTERIEWLDVQSKSSTPRGRLLEPIVQDRTEELIEAVRRAKVPFSRTQNGIRIWGYIRPGQSVQWCLSTKS